jgi:Tfp pilus assembly protein PilF
MFSDRNVQRYYQALAQRKLGETERADAIFRELAGTGSDSSESAPTLDLSASFNAVQSQRSRLANAHYVVGLGHLGLGEKDKAKEEFAQALQIGPDNLGVKTALAQLQ